ncbi:hypothetical protein K1719_038771 [Acacia pycnantha]|nr:hypothetical protein K1719_038771 [Acacia pycnantha]
MTRRKIENLAARQVAFQREGKVSSRSLWSFQHSVILRLLSLGFLLLANSLIMPVQEAFEQEISILKKEETRLMEENQRLNQEVKFLEENQRLELVQRLEQDQDQSLLATSPTTR